MDKPAKKGSLSQWERDRVRGSKHLQSRARVLRRQASEAEKVLWQQLRRRQLEGYKFRRQVVFEPYIVDFVCLEARLIIEADGGQHTDRVAYDALRTAKLESKGYRVLRFWNHQILVEIQNVLEEISRVLLEDFSDQFEDPSPQPSPRGRGS